MENPEEILHSLEEFSKMKPKDIPRELEEYIKFVAKTGDPIYQWSAIKSLFREKLINVITEFYESRSSLELPPCPNVELFNYDLMKNFILEKLETFSSAPFTLQRLCELLANPHKEYTRIDKYMRALEKNILVVSTMEPGGRRTENGDSFMNGIESDHEHVPDAANEINVEEMDETPYIQTTNHLVEHSSFDSIKNGTHIHVEQTTEEISNEKLDAKASTSSQGIVCVQYVSIEPVEAEQSSLNQEEEEEKDRDVSVTITAINVTDDEPVPEEEKLLEPQNDEVKSTEDSIIQMETEQETNVDDPTPIAEAPAVDDSKVPEENLAEPHIEVVADQDIVCEEKSKESCVKEPTTESEQTSEIEITKIEQEDKLPEELKEEPNIKPFTSEEDLHNDSPDSNEATMDSYTPVATIESTSNEAETAEEISISTPMDVETEKPLETITTDDESPKSTESV